MIQVKFQNSIGLPSSPLLGLTSLPPVGSNPLLPVRDHDSSLEAGSTPRVETAPLHQEALRK